jgi:hypothetical protein
MTKMSNDELRAFGQLRGTPIQIYLESAYAAIQDQLVTQTDLATLRRLQGQGQAYKHLLQSILFTGKHGTQP